jgi:PAS domain S-box-containing protein
MGLEALLEREDLPPEVRDAIERELDERPLAEAVGESEKGYRATLDSMADAIHVVDRELRIGLANQALVRWNQSLGLTVDVTGKTVFEIYPFLPETVRQEYLQVFESGQALISEEDSAVAGASFATETRKIPIRRGARVAAVVTVIRNVTERRRAERGLRESEQRYRSLAEALPDMVFIVGRDGRVEFVNSHGAQALRADVDDLIGRPVAELFPEPVSARQLKGLKQVFDSGRPLHGENVTPFGKRELCLDTWLVPLFSPEGAVASVLGVSRDITEKKRLEGQLRERDKLAAMGSLVGAVAHEVRNPLFALSATVDVMEARLGNVEGLGNYLGRLRHELDRLSALMRDLLDYGRPNSPALAPGSLAPVLDRALEACRPLAEKSAVTLSSRVPPGGLPEIVLDGGRLVQVFENVIENAIQHSPASGTVRVEARVEDEGERPVVRVRVEDQGPGFAPDDIKKVFEPFFSQRRGGTGLGLAIAWRIVQDHGGAIEAVNTARGGAEVRVTLPALTGAPQPAGHSQPNSAPVTTA